MNNEELTIDMLINEIKRGEHKIDILKHDATFEFSGAYQAAYFANARDFLKTELAHQIMTCSMPERDIPKKSLEYLDLINTHSYFNKNK